MARALRTSGHKRKEKNSVHNLPYGPRTRPIRGMYLTYNTTNATNWPFKLCLENRFSKTRALIGWGPFLNLDRTHEWPHAKHEVLKTAKGHELASEQTGSKQRHFNFYEWKTFLPRLWLVLTCVTQQDVSQISIERWLLLSLNSFSCSAVS